MRSRPVTRGVLFLAMLAMGAAPLRSQAPQPSNPELEVFPKHFVLHPGEQIHYQVRVREGERSRDVPDHALISEGQEHEIHVAAERVTFTGGGFMACTLRNVQMTLHGMVKHGERRINFVFPAEAIWVGDEERTYPAPMVLLQTLFARRAGDADAHDNVVVPFLERVITQFPILGYPPNAPAPPLRDLLKDWRIVVRFGDRFERVYQPGDSDKNLLIEFKLPSTP